MFVIVFIIGNSTLEASAIVVNSESFRYDYYLESTNTFRRQRVYYLKVYEFDTPVQDVPLKALNSGVNIQSNVSFSLSKEKTISSGYSVTETIGTKLSAEYGTSATADASIISTEVYTKFAAEFSASYSNTINRTISERTVETNTYNVSSPADYGFYTVTLYAYEAKQYLISLSWHEYTCSRDNSKSDWSSSKHVASGHYSLNYYIPTASSTYVSFVKYDSPSDYANYMEKYHAIY